MGRQVQNLGTNRRHVGREWGGVFVVESQNKKWCELYIQYPPVTGGGMGRAYRTKACSLGGGRVGDR